MKLVKGEKYDMINPTKTLPTLQDAIDASAPEMVVEHDGMHDHQTCSLCHRSWGAYQDDYGPSVHVDDDDDGTICPDPNCGGLMGIVAEAHIDWPEGESK